MNHDCKTLTPGCYRCDLNRDEVQHAEDLAAIEAVLVLAHEKCRFPDEDLAIDSADAVFDWLSTPEGAAVAGRARDWMIYDIDHTTRV